MNVQLSAKSTLYKGAVEGRQRYAQVHRVLHRPCDVSTLSVARWSGLKRPWHTHSPSVDAGRSVLLRSADIISASRSCIEIFRLLSSVVSCSTADLESFNLLRRLRICAHTPATDTAQGIRCKLQLQLASAACQPLAAQQHLRGKPY